ncbi:MAG: tRNA pseudouridine(38-40) synthase TruA [Clostridia bacterium]|nr:tRNA pseudouridine(38-40) synthase TruA [Clostridia bacterium]
MSQKLLLKIRYNGSAFVGWQVQKNGKSVQEQMQDAIEAIFGERVGVTGCSRTDSGVHALEYCMCFDPPREMELKRIPFALNSVLPEEISVLSCQDVSADFHPRYNAVAKEYLYRFYDGFAPDPFKRGLAFHERKGLNAELMDQAAKAFLGTHDFKAFMSTGSKIEDTVRTIHYSRVERSGNDVTFRVVGDGFLYNMVRIMAGTLLFVSMGRMDSKELPAIIAAGDRSKCGKTMPPYGLYLNKVYYDEKEVPHESAELGG